MSTYALLCFAPTCSSLSSIGIRPAPEVRTRTLVRSVVLTLLSLILFGAASWQHWFGGAA